MIAGPAASASPGYLLEMQILRPQLESPELETQGLGLAICVLTAPPGDSGASTSLRSTILMVLLILKPGYTLLCICTHRGISE